MVTIVKVKILPLPGEHPFESLITPSSERAGSIHLAKLYEKGNICIRTSTGGWWRLPPGRFRILETYQTTNNIEA